MVDIHKAGEREEPPFVHNAIVGGAEAAASGLRSILRAIDQRVLVWCWAIGAIGVFVLVVIASAAAEPTVIGVLKGLFAGAFIALLFAVVFGSMLLWARTDRKQPTPSSARAAELDARLEPALRELKALRRDIIDQVKARSVTRVPAGVVASVAIWFVLQSQNDPPGWPHLLLLMVIGAVAGEYWAAHALDRQYRRRYKDRVLPMIAGDLGALTYRPASIDEVERLGALRIVPDFDRIAAEDEIAGTYHGLPLRITEVCLRRRRQKKSVVVFDGLFVGITLPRTLSGTTVIVTDRGAWENIKSRWQAGTLDVVRLDDIEFEQRYEVYGSDQIEARALLTPAFMERFLELARGGEWTVPGAIAEGNVLIVALPKRFGAGDLFEPPAYWQPVGGAALVRLENDIRAVLRLADTVIALDFWASGRRGRPVPVAAAN